ncbi:aBC-type dipeptide/oligopeptide/nickel transport system ATPase component [Firmicutes bacterium CAG:882]|nr:aBC-type dipeptide/oligopeptide/nickel transport system ATPase component [Firmicutes bacterium CAG:882]
MEKKLSVNNLVISFRTPAGKVQAVRNISFDLNKGETLAIVGESGSGKSVTSKAILGILAGNSIVESGSIIYDGMDLLRISEDEFYHVRGDKIAMIFQDPLSSLNPIMRIGKQLTEAMLLKGKARQKSCRSAFNDTLALLADAMVEAEAAGNSVKAEELRQMCKNFDKFEFKHIELEQAYNEAHEAALEAHDEIKDILFYIEKNAFEDEKYTLKEVARLAGDSFNDWVVNGEEASELKRLIGELNSVSGSEIKSRNYVEVPRVLKEMDKIIETAVKKDEPDFFSMGYYITFANEPLPQKSVKELNDFLRKYADEHFIDNFRECAAGALEHNAKKYNELKKEALKVVAEQKSVFEADKLDKKVCLDAAAIMAKAIDASIDKLEIHKDSVAYTFGSTLKILINSYFTGINKNVTAAKKHANQSAKYEKLVAKGKTPSWKVAPSTAVDLDLVQENIVDLIERLENHYKEVLETADSRNYQNETSELIKFFKNNASGVVMKITKSMAKYKALKLMEEVGIPDVRKRYRQYPFEFSGGMRQRIVIAIALAADPDILICDEPTTALDVTIQAQILELINKIKKDRNLSIIFITHDLGVVANMADRIAVMYAGKIVETGTCQDVFYAPAHPYTWALLSAMPDVDTNEKLEAIPGTPPNMIYPPVGDAFADRNKYALQIDFEMQPPMFKISDTHYAATWLLHPDAPKVELPKIITERIARMKSKGGAVNAE